METRNVQQTTVNTQVATQKKSKRLSKLGEWMRKPNRETIVIMDMKAVLK